MVEISVDFRKRTVKVGSAERKLSNYSIKHLRILSGAEGFGEDEAEAAVRKLVDEQIIPFLRDAGKEESRENVEREFREAFEKHLYILSDPE